MDTLLDNEPSLEEETNNNDNNHNDITENGHESPEVSLSSPSPPEFSMNVADYQLGAVIGFGSSAIVHMATYLPLNLQVAVKMIELDHFERNRIDELRKEIQVMALCKHPNLLGILTSFVSESKLWIVTPFLAGGSCLDVMKTGFKDGFEESVIATILYQALQGLQYLHEHGHIHRDVKSGNLLMAEDGLVQLADFGVSASLADDGERKGVRKTYVGTPCWMAPEVMEITRGYDFKADIWSFGITALELAYGHAPYAKFPPMKVIYLTLSGKPPTLDRKQCARPYSRAFKDMIDSCLQRDPAKRPTARALLKHAFFKSVTKRPSFLVEAVLSRIPPVNLRDKSAQLRARGYLEPGEESKNDASETPLKSPISESNQESWDFSLGEEDDEEESVEGENDLIIKEEEESELLLLQQAEEDNEMTLPSRASRFIVAEESGDVNQNEEAAVLDETIDEELATRSTSPPSNNTNNNNASNEQPGSNGPTEVKKGRFSVLEATPDEVVSEAEETSVLISESAVALEDNSRFDDHSRFEETSRFEVSQSTQVPSNEPFKGFSERLSRPASTPGYHDYSNYSNVSGNSVTINPSSMPIVSTINPHLQQHHHHHHHQPQPQNHKLDALLQMNEYIRAQLIEMKQQETIRSYQPGSPPASASILSHPLTQPLTQPQQPLHSQQPYYHAYPPHPLSHHYPPSAYYPPPPSHPPTHPLTLPQAHQALPVYPLPHHTIQPVPSVHHSGSFSPSPSSTTLLDPHYQTSTSAASLGDSSTSIALSSILRELEAIRRENEILKANLRRE